MSAYLEIIEGVDKGKRVPINVDSITIGRSPASGNSVLASSRAVSR